jgi:small subunit ribosomal protein S1
VEGAEQADTKAPESDTTPSQATAAPAEEDRNGSGEVSATAGMIYKASAETADQADLDKPAEAQAAEAVGTETAQRAEPVQPQEATQPTKVQLDVADGPAPETSAAAEDTLESSSEQATTAEAVTSQVDTSMDPVAQAAAAEPLAQADSSAEPVTQAATEQAPPPVPAPRVYEGPEPTTMEELLNEQATEIKSLKHGDVVEGNVVRIDKDEILVDIGAKSEGVISNRELYGRNAESQPQLNIGDQVLVYVLQPESPEGHAVLSLRRAGLERKWRAMQEQLDAGAIIEAPVIDHNKGGLIVDCGIRGFVPISQIVDFPRRPQNEQPRDAAQEIAEKLQPYVGRKLRLKILEVNRKANRLILSEKVALYEERREKRDELFSSLQVGQKVTGTVRSIAPFGVFVDLGGIDGLVHKSELSWNKVNNPEAGYRVGEEVEAEVIDINHERGRISLSIRRLQPDPWHSTVADLKVGDIIDGTVTKIVNFGAFVRVRDGLEGLIHISELSHQRVVHPGDVVHEGQTLKLKIISLDQERHRLGLSLKQAEEAPARTEPSERHERRPRGERGGGYDMSQAVQEPEGGIDNTLAAAFAQVRQQMEETEAARATTESPEATAEATAEPAAEATAEPAEATAEPAAEATAEPAEATAEPAAGATAEPAAEATAEPAEATAEPAAEATAEPAEATAEPAAGATAEPVAEAIAEPVAEATAEPAEATAEPAAEAAKSKRKSKAKAGKDAKAPADEPAENGGRSAPEADAASEEAPA